MLKVLILFPKEFTAEAFFGVERETEVGKTHVCISKYSKYRNNTLTILMNASEVFPQ